MGNDYPQNLKVLEYLDEVSMGGVPLYQVKPEEHKKRLHKYIGALLASNKTLPGKKIMGSGVLISPDLVLTAAHNVWHRKKEQENFDIKFYPQLCGSLNSSPSYNCSVVFYPEKHKKNQDPIFDYALLRLSKPILDKDDFLPLSPFIAEDIEAANQKKLAIYGYPA